MGSTTHWTAVAGQLLFISVNVYGQVVGSSPGGMLWSANGYKWKAHKVVKVVQKKPAIKKVVIRGKIAKKPVTKKIVRKIKIKVVIPKKIKKVITKKPAAKEKKKMNKKVVVKKTQDKIMKKVPSKKEEKKTNKKP